MIGGDGAAPVLFERRAGVATLTLNRPDVGNAIDVALARGLFEAVTIAADDDAIRCVVVRGNGRMFCAGGDVKALQGAGGDLPALLREILASLHPAILGLARMAKPVITAIQGPAAGAGLGLAAVGDIALAEPAAHFSMAYAKIGLSPDGGATWLLPRLVGLRQAQELALTNRRVTAQEAVEMELITRVVAEGALAVEVEALASALADGPAQALGRTKRLLMAGSNASLEAQLEAESDAIVAQGGTAEAEAGLTALVERRQPDFRGSGAPA